MKKFLRLLMVLTLIMAMTIPVMAESQLLSNSNADQYVPGELIVSIQKDNGYSTQSIRNNIVKHTSIINSKKGFNIKKSLIDTDENNIKTSNFDSNFKATVIENMGYVYLVGYSSNEYKTIDHAIKALKQELESNGLKVNSIEPNYIMHAIGEVAEDEEIQIYDVHNNQKWQYEMIKAPQAWDITPGSMDVKIAVVDTGIDYNHQSLRNYVNTSLGKNFTSSNSSDFMDRAGHGTHVAGTIASYGIVSGVMKQGTLIPVKVLGDNGSGSVYGIIEGILHAANVGADVINMSLGGGGYVQAFDNACQTAMSKGVIIVAASGNEYSSRISYPAAYDGVIAVGAVDSNRNRASFSNYGTGLDVMAPGVNVYSTVPNNGYQYMSGTSMASPHVAGVAGLMRSVNKNISVQEAADILRETAQYAGDSYYYGYGIVDAYEAVKAARGEDVIEPIFKDISTQEAAEMIAANKNNPQFVILDVRTPEEYKEAHIEGAINIDYYGDNFRSEIEKLDRDKKYLVYCRTQGRSGYTVDLMKELNFKEVYRMLGGMNKWLEEGRPVVSLEPEPEPEPDLPIYATITTITTDKTEYLRGETAKINIKVTDRDGRPMPYAWIDLYITRPNGTTFRNILLTNTSGIAVYNFNTTSSMELGTYKITANTFPTNGYENSTANTTIKLVDEVMPEPDPEPEPEPEPDLPIYATITTITTDKTEYLRGETAKINIKVTDRDGRPMPYAWIDLYITRPNGTTFRNILLTNTSGIAVYNFNTTSSMELGTYKITANTFPTNGYENSTANTTIKLVDEVMPEPDPEPEPEPDPIPIKKTLTNISTDKTSYKQGEKITATIKVTDENKNALIGATVKVTLTNPRGINETATLTTNSYGIATFTKSTCTSDPVGTYTIKVDTTLSGYEPSSASTSVWLTTGGG